MQTWSSYGIKEYEPVELVSVELAYLPAVGLLFSLFELVAVSLALLSD